jgi:hypothetical protein
MTSLPKPPARGISRTDVRMEPLGSRSLLDQLLFVGCAELRARKCLGIARGSPSHLMSISYDLQVAMMASCFLSRQFVFTNAKTDKWSENV